MWVWPELPKGIWVRAGDNFVARALGGNHHYTPYQNDHEKYIFFKYYVIQQR